MCVFWPCVCVFWISLDLIAEDKATVAHFGKATQKILAFQQLRFFFTIDWHRRGEHRPEQNRTEQNRAERTDTQSIQLIFSAFFLFIHGFQMHLPLAIPHHLICVNFSTTRKSRCRKGKTFRVAMTVCNVAIFLLLLCSCFSSRFFLVSI